MFTIICVCLPKQKRIQNQDTQRNHNMIREYKNNTQKEFLKNLTGTVLHLNHFNKLMLLKFKFKLFRSYTSL